MASNISLDGVAAATGEIRDWLKTHIPVTSPMRADLRYTRTAVRDSLTVKRLTTAMKERARIPLKWRARFSEMWKVSDEMVVKISNSILRDMETNLAEGKPIFIDHFGMFKVRSRLKEGRTIPKLVFVPDPDWIRGVNTPTKPSELGIMHKIDASGAIVRR